MTVKGIEVGGTIYDNEDETARNTATEAASTARTASQTATTASQTATTASQTATTASQTATQANEKATTNATAISNLQTELEDLDNEVLKTSDLTSAVTEGSSAPVTSGGVFQKTRILNSNYLSLVESMLPAIKQSADATQDYTAFNGSTQTGREGSWWGFKKNPTFWTCLLITGGGEVTKVLYNNETYIVTGVV